MNEHTKSAEEVKQSLTEGNRGVQKGDNPFTDVNIVDALYILMNRRKVFSKEHDLSYASFDLLTLISYRWIREGRGSSVYALCEEPKNCTNQNVRFMIDKLTKKGLIEVYGNGKNKCNLYVPSGVTLRLMRGDGVKGNIAA